MRKSRRGSATDGKVIAAWREVAWDENNQGGVRKQNPVFADDGSQTAQREVNRHGQKVRELLVVYPLPKRRVTGKYLTQAYRSIDPQGRPIVGFSFNDQGRRTLRPVDARIRSAAGRLSQPAGDLDQRSRSISAQVNEPIDGGSGIIDGQFTPQEVDELVKSLDTQDNARGGRRAGDCGLVSRAAAE